MKRNLVIATVAATALIGGGTVAAYASGGDDGAPGQGQSQAQAQSQSQSQSQVRVADDRDGDTIEVRAGKVAAADAIAAALKHTAGTAVAADLDDDGARAWEVDVVKGDGTEYAVSVDSDTGKVLGAQRDDDDDDDGRDGLAALQGTSVDAREAATAAAGKGVVTDVDLDDDQRFAVWSVETAKGEWTVDAHTGKVAREHGDSDGSDDD